MVKKATGADVEEVEGEDIEEKKKLWKWCLSCMILVVSKEDFVYVSQDKPITIPAFYQDQKLSPVERYLKELEEIGGISISKVMPFLVELEDQSLNSIQGSIGEIFVKIAEEEKEYSEKCKQLEMDENNDELSKTKAKRVKLLEEREKKASEKKDKLL